MTFFDSPSPLYFAGAMTIYAQYQFSQWGDAREGTQLHTCAAYSAHDIFFLSTPLCSASRPLPQPVSLPYDGWVGWALRELIGDTQPCSPIEQRLVGRMLQSHRMWLM